MNTEKLINLYLTSRQNNIAQLKRTAQIIREENKIIKMLRESKEEMERLKDFHKASVASLESAGKVEIAEPIISMDAPALLPPTPTSTEVKFGAWRYDRNGEKKKLVDNERALENCRCAVVRMPPCSWCESGGGE